MWGQPREPLLDNGCDQSLRALQSSPRIPVSAPHTRADSTVHIRRDLQIRVKWFLPGVQKPRKNPLKTRQVRDNLCEMRLGWKLIGTHPGQPGITNCCCLKFSITSTALADGRIKENKTREQIRSNVRLYSYKSCQRVVNPYSRFTAKMKVNRIQNQLKILRKCRKIVVFHISNRIPAVILRSYTITSKSSRKSDQKG